MALDIPETAALRLPLRNASVKGLDRNGFVIDGLERSIRGTNTQGAEFQFRGHFLGTPVYLGELQTDAAGRLRFLGGLGKSDSPTGAPIFPTGPNGFINADGWYDDVSDGPVTAEVVIEGRQIPVEGAWVVTAPPDFAPGLKGVRTLYDLLFDLYVRSGWLPFPEVVSFRDHVYPILQRLSRLQWVNKGFATQFGPAGPNNFEDPDYIAKLACRPARDGFDTYGELRRQVFNSFRDPDGTDNNSLPWPWIYGDAADVPIPANSPRQNATISPTQYGYLALWAAGHFEDDWGVAKAVPKKIEEVALKDQPAMLDRAALEFCLADAFHPGCKVTWPIWHLTMFELFDATPLRVSRPFPPRHLPIGAASVRPRARRHHRPRVYPGGQPRLRRAGLPHRGAPAYGHGHNPVRPRPSAAVSARVPDSDHLTGPAKAPGSFEEVSTEWLIDATGRRAAVARQLGAVRNHHNRLVAFFARFRPSESSPEDRNSRTLIEAAPDGWWYTALIPSGERVFAFLTDSDLADRAALLSESGFMTSLKTTRHVGRLLAAHERQPYGDPRGTDAGSARLNRFSGEGWLAVGDAALAFDPLSSQGILNALYMGVTDAQTIAHWLSGNLGLIVEYWSRLGGLYGAYFANRGTYYATESHWHDHSFWHWQALLNLPTEK